MALLEVPGLLLKAKFPFGNDSKVHILPSKFKRSESVLFPHTFCWWRACAETITVVIVNPPTIQAKANTRTEGAEPINRRIRKKMTRTSDAYSMEALSRNPFVILLLATPLKSLDVLAQWLCSWGQDASI